VKKPPVQLRTAPHWGRNTEPGVVHLAISVWRRLSVGCRLRGVAFTCLPSPLGSLCDGLVIQDSTLYFCVVEGRPSRSNNWVAIFGLFGSGMIRPNKRAPTLTSDSQSFRVSHLSLRSAIHRQLRRGQVAKVLLVVSAATSRMVWRLYFSFINQSTPKHTYTPHCVSPPPQSVLLSTCNCLLLPGSGVNHNVVDGMVTDPQCPTDLTLLSFATLDADPSSGTKDSRSPINPHING
jgi:hypothetical protein